MVTSTSQYAIKKVVKRDGNTVEYDRDRITTAIFKSAASVGGSDRQMAEDLAKEVEKTLAATYAPPSIPTVEDVQDVVEATLIKHGHVKTARAFIIYRHDRAQARASRSVKFEATDNIPYKKIYEVLRWNMDHNCETIEGLNNIVTGGKYPELVKACDQRYSDEVKRGAEKILERLPEVRIVIIAGPSSSGKTTTTIIHRFN